MTAAFSDHLKRLSAGTPALHIVLGSGLSGALEGATPKGWTSLGEVPFADVNGLRASTAPGHRGTFRFYKSATGQTLCVQAGRVHGYEGLTSREAVSPVMVSRTAGTKRFLLTNAAGALNPAFKVGSLMLIRDHVNLTGANPLVGPNPVGADGQPLGPRFPDMSAVYSPAMRARLESVLREEARGLYVTEGVYLGLMGPTYETPAEVRLFSSWGLDAVGMSTVWEAISLKHAGAEVGGLSFISNMGCGMAPGPLSHEEVEVEGRRVAGKLVPALFDYARLEIDGGKS